MNTRKLLSSLIVFFAVINVMVAQQPFGGCWHPDYIINWSPEKDPDAKFNRSTVKLQPRFVDTSVKANANQHPEGKVAACLTMNPMCSQTPSQGADNFIGYNPTYWQYMDLLIWWGGSAGEGIIIPPSAPVTDAAHLNGVKVLGQLFFPPGAFGGQTKWVRQMLTKEGSEFPYAKKMYEIAAYYGFDGWFLNEETGGGSSSEWTEWVAYFNKCAEAAGDTHMEIQWYDCATTIGNYGEMMKLHNASYFLNYGSPTSYNIQNQMTSIKGLGFSDEEAFSKLYFGIEAAQGGMSGNASYFKSLFPADAHAGSIDIFNPEEHIWKKVVEGYLGTEQACGEQAYRAMNTVFNNEARYWTNEQHDPSDITARDGSYFPGMANAILERSTIQELPFVTSFSAGLGKHRFVNGEKKGTHDWYHRGMQDIMPTWRWWVDVPAANKEDLSFNLNWDDAYNMGTSIIVNGKLAANVDYLTRLYKTKLAINTGDKLQLIFKSANASAIQVKLGIAENANAFTTFNLTSTTTKNGWTVATVDLSSLASKTISVIALNFKTPTEITNFEATLGQLAVYPAGYAPNTVSVSNMQIQNKLTQDGGDIRIIWDTPVSQDIHHFNVYMIRDGKSSLVGQTRNEGFYIPKFNRSSPQEMSVKVAVSAVNKDLQEGTAIEMEVKYPDIEKPEVSIKANKTLGRVNDEITFEAKATNFPDSYSWTLPQGVEKVEENGNIIKLKFTQEGNYDIQVAVTNRIGTTTHTEENLVEISNAKAEELKIVSVNKTIHSASGSLPPEDPSNLIDGVEVPGSVRDKWCIGGSKEHWVIIDLHQPYNLYRFKIFDCGHKENYSDNFQNFKIWVSNDAENWTLVIDEKGRPENTKDDYIAPHVGRYVKFMPYDEEKPITIRIWEFEAFGLEGGPLFSMPENQMLNIGEKKDFQIDYSLEGEEEANFSYAVTSIAPSTVKISDVAIDKVAGKINFKAEGLEMGASQIKLEIQNGNWLKSKEFTLSVDDPTFSTNILENKSIVSAKYLYYGSSWYDVPNATNLTDGNIETAATFASWVNTQNFEAIIDCGVLYDIAKFKINTSLAPTAIAVYGAVENLDTEYSLMGSVNSTTEETSFYTQKTTCRFIKVKMQVPAQSFSIYEIMAFGKENGGEIQETVITPLVIKSGFNADVIAESTPSKNSSSLALDDQGWVFYTAAVQENGSISTDGSLTSTSGILYQLGDVAANNAVLMKSVKTADIEFIGDQKAQRLYFLTTSANGASNVDVTVHYTDGSSEATTTLSLDDWFGASTSGTAKTGLSRIIRETSGMYAADDIDDRYQFRLFESSIKTDDSKIIAKVSLKNTSSSYPVLFAVSKKSLPEDVTGLNNAVTNNFRVYPNPIQNGSSLHIESTEGASIELMSLQGTLLLHQQAISDHTAIPVTGFAQGTYILTIRSNGGVQTTKVVIR